MTLAVRPSLSLRINIAMGRCGFAAMQDDLQTIQAITGSGRGAKATQEGLVGTIRGSGFLGRIGKTWLPLSTL